MDLASPAVSGTSVYANGLIVAGNIKSPQKRCLRVQRYQAVIPFACLSVCLSVSVYPLVPLRLPLDGLA